MNHPWINTTVKAATAIDSTGAVVILLSNYTGWKISGRHITNPDESHQWKMWLGEAFVDQVYDAVFGSTPNREMAQRAWACVSSRFTGTVEEALSLPLALFRRQQEGTLSLYGHEVVLLNGALVVLSVGTQASIVTCYFPGSPIEISTISWQDTVQRMVEKYAERAFINRQPHFVLPREDHVTRRRGARFDQMEFRTPEAWGFDPTGIWQGILATGLCRTIPNGNEHSGKLLNRASPLAI